MLLLFYATRLLRSGSGTVLCFLLQAEDGIRDLVRSRGLGDVYKRQGQQQADFLLCGRQDQARRINLMVGAERPRGRGMNPKKDRRVRRCVRDAQGKMIGQRRGGGQDFALPGHDFYAAFLLSLIHISEPTRPY